MLVNNFFIYLIFNKDLKNRFLNNDREQIKKKKKKFETELLFKFIGKEMLGLYLFISK